MVYPVCVQTDVHAPRLANTPDQPHETDCASFAQRLAPPVSCFRVGRNKAAQNLVYRLINIKSRNLAGCILLELDIPEFHTLDSLV